MNDVLKMVVCPVVVLFCAVVEIVCPFIGHADGSQQVPMLRGLSGWQATPVVTIGEFLPTRDLNASGGKYRLVGSMDGLGAYALDSRTVRVLVNHELARQAGYPYLLRNGTSLTGARVSFIDIDRKTRQPVSSGLAFNTVYDRQGLVVTQSQQMSLTSETTSGLSSLCSAQLVEGGQKGFADTIFLRMKKVLIHFSTRMVVRYGL